jgi:uncharacterized membrane protein YphA (DoxX/SURF4 family)
MNTLSAILFFLMRLMLALLFIAAGASKAFDPTEFLHQILAFEILPYWLAFGLAHVLPWFEIICGLALLTFNLSSAAALLLMMLTIGFMAFINAAVSAGADLDCGCFGKLIYIVDYARHMTLNWAMLVGLSLVFLRCAKLQRSVEKD